MVMVTLKLQKKKNFRFGAAIRWTRFCENYGLRVSHRQIAIVLCRNLGNMASETFLFCENCHGIAAIDFHSFPGPLVHFPRPSTQEFCLTRTHTHSSSSCHNTFPSLLSRQPPAVSAVFCGDECAPGCCERAEQYRTARHLERRGSLQ